MSQAKEEHGAADGAGDDGAGAQELDEGEHHPEHEGGVGGVGMGEGADHS